MAHSCQYGRRLWLLIDPDVTANLARPAENPARTCRSDRVSIHL